MHRLKDLLAIRDAVEGKMVSIFKKHRKFYPSVFGHLRFTFLILCLLTLLSCSGKDNNSKIEVRVISSKIGPLAVLRKQSTFAQNMAAKGYSVKWLEFPGGPQQMEAVNTGNLDITFAGESPSIFAQAAGIPVVYLATTNPNPKSVAFLVPYNSSIKNIPELKGKKITLPKASAVQYTLVKGLAQAGLKLSDVIPVYLAPADANIAFSREQVDAWVIWEPFITLTEAKKNGRILKDGEGLKDIGNFYMTSRKFAQQRREFIKLFLEEVQKAEAWSRENPRKFAELIADELIIDIPNLEKIISKYDPGILPITDDVIARQQKIADMYYEIGMLPQRVDIKQAVLTPQEYATFTPKKLTAKP
ncbi:aliphatic sulfonate ABC transporter substrate-binding protein [Iningainema tapete]|uniref:Putative aliphatic sulfonates-binding protein n=1 Tax=Iningainema tapete BLCC-T55 TaxID=2748662 RepID=A0A8J6Y0Q7_9CYAN|nr:aliphatic sulfonate ABC transporter substrate-binding protein [Iningainema tapete]MBD2776998.1 aliphatic sulfonate ABC transporter substrate-binding protein [Iningainema tapete BLCC-T55]